MVVFVAAIEAMALPPAARVAGALLLFAIWRRWRATTMPNAESTCWTIIRAAAAGSLSDREELARRYLGVVRAYLAARWRGTPMRPDLDDSVQEVFVECFRQGGAVEAAGAGRVPSFRAFLASAKTSNKKEAYADRAVELLRRAVQAGWRDAAHMRKDTDLDPLRGRDDFQKLFRQLEKQPAAGPG
jgi:hypothetical protein